MAVDINAIDTYIRHVRTRMADINSSRIIRGPVEAEDWPSKQVTFEALYLLILPDTPIGRQGYSRKIEIYSSTLQWAWIVLGKDLGDGQRGRNRADRYRTNSAIENELRKAHYPGFTQKVILSNPTGAALVVTDSDPPEPILWSPLEFGTRSDRESGVTYGTATTYLTSMTEEIVG